MTLEELRLTLGQPVPPPALLPPLAALWWDAKGEWERAHACVQSEPDADSAAVHAYLHRREGDDANAAYWYRRASRPVATGPLDDEWAALATSLVGRQAEPSEPVPVLRA